MPDRVASPARVGRRRFLLRPGARPRSVVLSCERLYMKYHDARMHGGVGTLLERLETELQGADEIRLTERHWLARGDFREEVERLLDACRSRGARIVPPSPVL